MQAISLLGDKLLSHAVCIALLLLLPVAGRAQDQPVAITITEITVLDFDYVNGIVDNWYAGVTIDGTTLSNFGRTLDFPGFLPSPSFAPFWVLTRNVPQSSGTVSVVIS